MTNAPLDLSQLALDRSPEGERSASPRRRRQWLARYLLPATILLGFLVLLVAAAGRGLMPRQEVTVVPVIVKRSVVQQAGTQLFQAPGWIEPRPTAISVAALAPGVIQELLVVEGQFVKKGEPVARLISIDAELRVEQARTSLDIRQGELEGAQAEVEAAKIRFANPVHLQAPLADARSLLAKTKTEIDKLPYLIEAAEAQLAYALDSRDGKRSAKGAVSDRVIALAESDYASANANLLELRNRKPNLQSEADALADKVQALERQLDLMVEETRQIQAAKAKLQSAAALKSEAALKLRQAELELQRNVVVAPLSGRVLRLVASPGARVMGLDSLASHSSSTVVEMYDPERLQVRVDVRLEDVPLVIQGQEVEIETASSKQVIKGRVLQSTSSANIQKNTLEVKVELLNPPVTVSPQMLVTATFLAPLTDQELQQDEATERVFVPSSLVTQGDDGASVWIVDADETAQQRRIEIGSESPDGLVEIKSGLQVTDKIISSGRDRLEQGTAVEVTGDDATMGIR
ncbi:efflux RND transporter periplasmic adaptor subunit [Allorhodopirellula solitaria]|uniref:Multidrug resistance protein MdtA n=1 Tax=Allorhodopirellula solitaria TaxID=2527987 RepID=A0A5C5YK02_9BACT|nr:efflux RND transporter periplasmic adaptor subunit [Allorhodopirellula solitaria]TWT75230.1 Multidrug resistance protein MdtA precursor [Allorhodopirellula solitaria]